MASGSITQPPAVKISNSVDSLIEGTTSPLGEDVSSSAAATHPINRSSSPGSPRHNLQTSPSAAVDQTSPGFAQNHGPQNTGPESTPWINRDSHGGSPRNDAEMDRLSALMNEARRHYHNHPQGASGGAPWLATGSVELMPASWSWGAAPAVGEQRFERMRFSTAARDPLWTASTAIDKDLPGSRTPKKS